MIATLSDLTVAPQDVDRYVLMRRRQINPVLAEQPGFMGSTLWRARQQHDPSRVAFALFNFWADAEHAQAWSIAPRHDEVSQYVIPLVRSISSKRYQREDEVSLTPGDERLARMARISIQQIKADRVQEYLDYRRTVIHPSMAKAPGFVAAWVLRDVTDRARFALYFRWTSEETAEAYFHQPVHLGEITDRVKEMIQGPLVTSRYDIVPTEAP